MVGAARNKCALLSFLALYLRISHGICKWLQTHPQMSSGLHLLHLREFISIWAIKVSRPRDDFAPTLFIQCSPLRFNRVWGTPWPLSVDCFGSFGLRCSLGPILMTDGQSPSRTGIYSTCERDMRNDALHVCLRRVDDDATTTTTVFKARARKHPRMPSTSPAEIHFPAAPTGRKLCKCHAAVTGAYDVYIKRSRRTGQNLWGGLGVWYAGEWMNRSRRS